MFDNIGRKIKTLASVICWIGIIASILYGCIALLRGGIIVIILGTILSWAGSSVLYGFGQLVENSDKLVNHFVPEEKKPVYSPVQESQPAEPWVCYHCGTSNNARSAYCIKCDTSRSWSEERSKQN